MKKIKDIETALEVFKEAANTQAEATEVGDYRAGNKCYNKITEAAEFIKNEGAVGSLKQLLSHTSAGVRMWAVFYLLPTGTKEAERVLKEIAKSSGIHALTAETTLSEWEKGSLNF